MTVTENSGDQRRFHEIGLAARGPSLMPAAPRVEGGNGLVDRLRGAAVRQGTNGPRSALLPYGSLAENPRTVPSRSFELVELRPECHRRRAAGFREPGEHVALESDIHADHAAQSREHLGNYLVKRPMYLHHAVNAARRRESLSRRCRYRIPGRSRRPGGQHWVIIGRRPVRRALCRCACGCCCAGTTAVVRAGPPFATGSRVRPCRRCGRERFRRSGVDPR